MWSFSRSFCRGTQDKGKPPKSSIEACWRRAKNLSGWRAHRRERKLAAGALPETADGLQTCFCTSRRSGTAKFEVGLQAFQVFPEEFANPLFDGEFEGPTVPPAPRAVEATAAVVAVESTSSQHLTIPSNATLVHVNSQRSRTKIAKVVSAPLFSVSPSGQPCGLCNKPGTGARKRKSTHSRDDLLEPDGEHQPHDDRIRIPNVTVAPDTVVG